MNALNAHHAKRFFAISFVGALSLCATIYSQRYLSTRNSNKANLSEALYLPHRDAVAFLSFRYQRTAAHYLWFKTISYFGAHYVKDQNYQWLYHMCTLVTTLNPSALHVYEFGSTILSWEAKAAPLAQKLLDQGINANPDYWKLYYLRGMNSLYFLNNPESAKNDFTQAARLPEAHPIVTRLAAKALAASDDPKAGIEFLHDILQDTHDPAVKDMLLERLRDLHYENDLRNLERALTRYLEGHAEMPYTIEELIPFLESAVSNHDPFGGTYRVNREMRIIESSSGHKRLGAGK